jgi:hypothetical protein
VSDEQWNRFHEVVNMSSRELRDWLGVDAEDAAGEPAGVDAGPPADPDDRELGRRVLAVLGKRRTDLTHDDVDVMGHVVARVERLRGRLPEEPAAGTDRQRHRLMSLGHDPLRAG